MTVIIYVKSVCQISGYNIVRSCFVTFYVIYHLKLGAKFYYHKVATISFFFYFDCKSESVYLKFHRFCILGIIVR